jgi:hypothetical protein
MGDALAGNSLSISSTEIQALCRRTPSWLRSGQGSWATLIGVGLGVRAGSAVQQLVGLIASRRQAAARRLVGAHLSPLLGQHVPLVGTYCSDEAVIAVSFARGGTTPFPRLAQPTFAALR